jgi:hypothetical protein
MYNRQPQPDYLRDILADAAGLQERSSQVPAIILSQKGQNPTDRKPICPLFGLSYRMTRDQVCRVLKLFGDRKSFGMFL